MKLSRWDTFMVLVSCQAASSAEDHSLAFLRPLFAGFQEHLMQLHAACARLGLTGRDQVSPVSMPRLLGDKTHAH